MKVAKFRHALSVLCSAAFFCGGLFCGCVLISGCGTQQEAPQRSYQSAQTEIGEDRPVDVPKASEGSFQSAEASEANPSVSSDLTTDPSETSSTSLDLRSDQSSAAEPTVAEPAQVEPSAIVVQAVQAGKADQVAKVAAPTAEQLARWARPKFESYELLVCRQPTQVGLVNEMVVTPEGRQLMMAGQNIAIWAMDGDRPQHVFVDQVDSGKKQVIKSLAVSPDGNWFAAGDSEGLMRVWNLKEQTEVVSKQIYPTGITQIAIAPDGQSLATVSYDSHVSIWSVAGLELKQTFDSGTHSVKRIEYMSSTRLAVAGETTMCWEVESGKLEQELSPGRYRYTLARSADGKWFVFGESDGLQLWDVGSSERALKLVDTFASNEFVSFSPDGKTLLTANDFSVRLWDLSTGQLTQTLDAYGWPIVGLGWVPDAKQFVIGSGNGCTRMWGTPDSGKAFGLDPLHQIVGWPDATSHQPATPAQALQAIDLRNFPLLSGAKQSVFGASTLMYTAAVTLDEAEAFQRYHLGQQGWDETVNPIPTPGSMEFRKHGFMISVSCYDAGGGETTISLTHVGNYDLRWTPKFDAAPIEMVYENQNVVMYKTKADLLEIETSLIRKMHAAGWTAYSRLNTSHYEPEDGRNLTFLNNGVALQITVGRFPTDPASYTIQYSRSLEQQALPIPPDSGFVEFDGSTRPLLVAETSMTLQQAREFYESQLGVQGWLPHEVGRSLNEEAIWLPFFLGQRDLLVGLVKLANGRTRVRVGDELERSSWQLSLPGADEPKTRPERKTAMSYESWLRLNRHPAGLELLDTYQKEMQAVLKKSPTTVPKD